MATEPRTMVSIIDETINSGTDPVDTNLNILCPIISPTGPTKLTRVTGPSMLRKFFNGGAAITPESSQTLQYARAVSAQAPLYIKRASRSEIRGGKTTSSYGSEFYVDEMNNVLSGGILNLTQVIPAADDYDTLLEAFITPDENQAIERTDEYNYVTSYLSDSVLIKGTPLTYKPSNKHFIKFIGNVALTHDAKVNIGTTYSFTIPASSTNLNSLLIDFVDKDQKVIAINGSSVYFDTLNPPSESLTGTVSLIALGSDSIISVTLDAEDNGKLVVEYGDSDTPDTFYINTVWSKSEYNSGYITNVFSFELTTDVGSIHVYSKGVSYDTECEIGIEIPNNLSYDDVCKEIYDNLDTYLTLGAKNNHSFVISGLINAVDKSITGQTSKLSVSKTSFEAPSSDLFGIISKFPNNTNAITVKTVNNENDTYTLTINAFGDEEIFTISFIPGSVDGYGNDIYYTTVESNSNYVSVIPLGGNQVADESIIKIGAGVSNEFVGVAELTATLEEMMDTEESPVLFDYILDGGVVNSSYSSMILQACQYYKSYYPMSCQTDTMSVYNMRNNRNRIGNGEPSFRANFIAAAERSAVLDQGLMTVPASYYYLRRRIELAQSVMEFSAIFGKNNGNIGITNPVKDYKKSDRESMLDSQILTLKRSMTDGSWYLNENLTCYGKKSYLQEDGVALMVNKISQVAILYAETLKGEYNTSELRAQVEGTLTQMLRTRMRVGTAYGPGSIRVQCDSINNTKNTIDQNKLIIDIYGRFPRTIKEVLIYEHVQPLEG